MVWVVREYMSCLNHIFQKKENAEKCFAAILRSYAGDDPYFLEDQGCATMEEFIDQCLEIGYYDDVVSIENVDFEDKEWEGK